MNKFLDIKKIGIQRESILNDDLNFVDIQTGIVLKMQRELNEKEDNIIKEALISNGFNPDNTDFLRDNFGMVINDNDKFVHYYFHYGLPDEKRIISVEKKKNIKCDNSIENKFTMTLSVKYY